MKILFLSDSHGWHWDIDIPLGIDMLIFSGDCSNYKDPYRNEAEVLDFIDWIEKVDIKHKIWIAGNHCTSIEKKLVRPKELCKTSIYLEHEMVEIEGLKIFGSPYTKAFGDWAFNVKPEKLFKLWESVPECDILITHGPPLGILDLSYNRQNELEFCGDKSLLKHIPRINPLINCFGHIHNNSNIQNTGTRVLEGLRTTFINSALVKDRHFEEGPRHNGIILEI